MKCKDEAKQSKFLVIRHLRHTEVRLHMMLLCPFRLKQQMKTRVFSPLWSKRQNALSLLHFNPKQEKGESKRYQSQRPNPRAEASPLETSQSSKALSSRRMRRYPDKSPLCSSIGVLNLLVFCTLKSFQHFTKV